MKIKLGALKRLIKEAVLVEAEGERLPPPEGWNPKQKFDDLSAAKLLELGNGYAMPLSWLESTQPEAAEALFSFLETGAPDYLQGYWRDRNKWRAQAPAHPSASGMLSVTNGGARISYLGGGVIHDGYGKWQRDDAGAWQKVAEPQAKRPTARASGGALKLPKDATTVDLSWQQVRKHFPEAVAAAQKNYAENVRIAKEEGDWDPAEPGILPPSRCAWYLEKDENLADSLPQHPGYALHMFDEDAIASYSGGGSDMVWTGDEWEM